MPVGAPPLRVELAEVGLRSAGTGPYVSEGGLELARKPCRPMPSSARSACYCRGLGDSTFQRIPMRAVRYPGVFRTFADNLMTSEGVCRTQGSAIRPLRPWHSASDVTSKRHSGGVNFA